MKEWEKKWDDSKNCLLDRHKNLLSSLFMKSEKKYERRKFQVLIISWERNSAVINTDKKRKNWALNNVTAWHRRKITMNYYYMKTQS